MTPSCAAAGRPDAGRFEPDPQALPGRRFAVGDDDLDDYDEFDDFEDDEDIGEDDEIDHEDFDYDEDDDDDDDFDETVDDDLEEDAYYVRLRQGCAGPRRGTRSDCGTRAAPARRTGAALPS